MEIPNYNFKNNGLGIYNDDVFDRLFDLYNNNYVLFITPKANTKFWRLGIRLSKTKDIEFYHPEGRYTEPGFSNFIDVHLGVGEWDGKTWTLPNRINLAQYNLKDKRDHILDRSESYEEFSDVTWLIQYSKEERLLYLSYDAEGVEKFSESFALKNEFRYFKIFAWADENEFEIDCIALESKLSNDIEIKNSGRISELKLRQIALINYVVGENRSGKSALLAGIANLSNNNLNARQYTYSSYLSKNASSLIIGNANPVKIELIDSLSVLSPFFKSNTTSNIIKAFLNTDLHIIEEMAKDDDGESVPLGKFGFENSPKARLSIQDAKATAASGDKTIAYLKKRLDEIKPSSSFLTIVIIDEPETHLNPRLHNEIHSLLEAKLEDTENLIFFVATHSSYLIASAVNSQTNTKVYCLVNGKLINSIAYWTDSQHKSTHLAKEAYGFKPSECKLLVHDILGATLKNYFPKILYCENSLKDFIYTYIDKHSDVYDRPLIIPSGNDINSAESANTMYAIIEGLRDYYKNNFNLLGPIAYAIVDKLNSSQKREKEMIEKINRKYPGAVIILSETEVERSYPDQLVGLFLESKSLEKWGKETSYKEYLDSHGLNKQDLGIHKSEIAINVGANISMDEFSKKFPQIHKLLAV